MFGLFNNYTSRDTNNPHQSFAPEGETLMTHQSAAPSNDSSLSVCPLCGRRTRRISVGEAASLAGVSTLTIRRYIEAGKIDAWLIAKTTWRVCRECLLNPPS
jgi:excisionase family DNA binding protein